MNPFRNATLLLCTLVSCVSGTCLAQAKELASLLDKVKAAGSDAKPEDLYKIAEIGTRDAMQGLVEFYDKAGSVYLKREVVFALAKFDGIQEAQQPALEKITNVATTATQPELRQAAVDALANSPSLGKHFLATIVQSEADDTVRKAALSAHVRNLSDEDLPFYKELWKPFEAKGRSKKGAKRGKDDPPDRPELEDIRVVAFEAVAEKVEEKDLIDILEKDTSQKMRNVALKALHRKGSKRVAELATKMFERVDVPGMTRSEAAKILAELQGAKLANAFLKLAKKKAVTPEDLRRTMASLLGDMKDKSVDQKLVKLIGRGAPYEKVFALWATMHIDDPKLVEKIRKGLADKDAEVRRETALVLAERGDKDSLEELYKMLDKPKEPADVRFVIEAISKLEGRSAAWVKRLEAFVTDPDRDIRNAALEQLSKADAKGLLEYLKQGLIHKDWSTRYVAIDALRDSRNKEAVPLLIDALGRESGRLGIAVADALWSLTAQTFEQDAKAWRAWWDKEGKSFEVPTAAELEKAATERELKRLKETTVVAKFFGVEITSQRVIFILDVSGSMVEPVLGRYEGKREATRLEVAKRELLAAIESLAGNALFNIFVFSSGVERWAKEDIGGMTKKTREQAKVWIDRLGAGGGTNLYDAVKEAFDDPDVDTIYLLSDGEPTAGEVTDPAQIRDDVKRWNEHRKIVIHTVAVGGSLQILEHLALDSGGKYVTFR
ncbi:MAG: HEAT repeat domain-containing protein [Planctomycetes bacterium]|nr:HEAT repeat domain-containing protein [Planctomycetota bacterium]